MAGMSACSLKHTYTPSVENGLVARQTNVLVCRKSRAAIQAASLPYSFTKKAVVQKAVDSTTSNGSARVANECTSRACSARAHQQPRAQFSAAAAAFESNKMPSSNWGENTLSSLPSLRMILRAVRSILHV